MAINVCIIGAGPAGIGCARRLLSSSEQLNITIMDGGNDLKTRVRKGEMADVISGFGGAGAFSDRKISVPPAGSGILERCKTNDLRDTYLEELDWIENSVDTSKDKIRQLKDVVREYFAANKEYHYSEGLKQYSTICLANFEEAYNWLESYEKFFNKHKNLTIKYNTIVNKIEKINNKYMVYHNAFMQVFDYIVICTGRFGSMQKIIPNLETILKRLEIGVRLVIDHESDLYRAIMECQEKNKLCVDPKYIVNKNYNIIGYNTAVEFRTFCVCINGYTVKSTDVNSNMSTYSGSSSFNEYELRKNKKHIAVGSNMGIMMRIKTSDLLYNNYEAFLEEIKEKCKSTEQSEITINMNNMSEYVDTITKYFPKELAFPLIDGIGTLISTITMKPTNNITIRLPCVEGVCRYPKLDDITMMSTSHNNLFFAGDIVGHTRGLLQGFVMGNIVGKNIITKTRGNNIYKIWMEIKSMQWEDIDKLWYIIAYNNQNQIEYKCYKGNGSLYIVPINDMVKMDGYSVIITTANNNYNNKKNDMDTLVGMMSGPNAIENIYDKLVYYNDVLSDTILVHFKSMTDAMNFGEIIKIFTKLQGITFIKNTSIDKNPLQMKDVYLNNCTQNDIIERILNAKQYMYFITSNPNKTHEINKMIKDKSIYIFTLGRKPSYSTIPIFTEESNISNINNYNGVVFSKLIDIIGLDNVVKCYNNEKCRFSSIITCYHNGDITKYEHYIEGIIVERKGDNGFGWDPIFYYPEMNMTFGEMTTEMKNKYSPRIKTLTQFLNSF